MTTPNRGSGELNALLDQLREYVTPQPPWISLPPRAFTSPELYELELDRIFRRSWIMVARVDQLAGPGDYLALTIAGEPLLLTATAPAHSTRCRRSAGTG